MAPMQYGGEPSSSRQPCRCIERMTHFQREIRSTRLLQRFLEMRTLVRPYLPRHQRLSDGDSRDVQLLYVETLAIAIFGSSAYLAGGLHTLVAIGIISILGYGIQGEAEHVLARRPDTTGQNGPPSNKSSALR